VLDAAIAIAIPPVCMSVCPSHQWSTPKRFEILKYALHHTTYWCSRITVVPSMTLCHFSMNPVVGGRVDCHPYKVVLRTVNWQGWKRWDWNARPNRSGYIYIGLFTASIGLRVTIVWIKNTINRMKLAEKNDARTFSVGLPVASWTPFCT